MDSSHSKLLLAYPQIEQIRYVKFIMKMLHIQDNVHCCCRLQLEQVSVFQVVSLLLLCSLKLRKVCCGYQMEEGQKDFSRNLSSMETQCPPLIFAAKSGLDFESLDVFISNSSVSRRWYITAFHYGKWASEGSLIWNGQTEPRKWTLWSAC